MALRDLSGPRRVAVLGTILATAAAGLFLGVIDAGAPPIADVELPLPLLTMTVLFVTTESFVVHLRLRRQTQSFSLSEIPLVLGLFFVSPVVLLAARLIGSAIALIVFRRQPAVKAAYNLAWFALDTCLMLSIFHLIVRGQDPLGPYGWLGTHLAGAVGMIGGTCAVAAAIWLTEHTLPPDLARGVTSVGLPTAFVNVNIGLVAVTLLDFDPRSGVLLLGFAVTLYVFYRSHADLRASHDSLGELYAVTGTVDDALERGGALETLLERTADLLRAEVADLVLSVGDKEPRRYIWHADSAVLERTPADAIALVRDDILGDRTSVVLSGRKDRDELDRLGGYQDAVLFRLDGSGHLSGTMMVADRLGNVATFTADDQRLFEALGTHASIAMRNSTLLERLRIEVVEREHEALHDALTSLPNRTLFDREVAAALERRSPDHLVTVMLIDLDRFKEVNDTLGHQQGDRLLERASRRIASVVGERGLVARLGGDEFAVVLPRSESISSGVAVAQEIRRRIERPFDLDGIPVVVGASIGIAIAPEDAADPESLLQRADVAMYAAKKSSGIERYHPSVNHYSPERLAMVAELRRAIDRAELLVEYQPCLDLRTGQVVAAEALARWHHPDHGYVAPDVFIPIAERSGLIRGVTSHVLRTAIRQCAAWRDEGLDVRVAVNLSARCLVDDDLPAEIQELLDQSGLRTSSLVLEITESSIMGDPRRTIGMLNKLSSMGITLSIDDYGTGYSSLSYLKNLPVDELKIDRSFVTMMRTDPRDAVIVRNTIDLAHELSLRIVAEGIEDEATLALLTEMGCDLAQGYHICRPRTAIQFADFATTAGRPQLPRSAEPVSLDERRRLAGM